MSRLHTEIMRVNARTELDFLHHAGVLVFLGFLVLFRLLVTELAVINDAADGRVRGRCDFNQIDSAGAGKVQSFREGKDARLFAIEADDPDFASTDFPVDPDE